MEPTTYMCAQRIILIRETHNVYPEYLLSTLVCMNLNQFSQQKKSFFSFSRFSPLRTPVSITGTTATVTSIIIKICYLNMNWPEVVEPSDLGLVIRRGCNFGVDLLVDLPASFF